MEHLNTFLEYAGISFALAAILAPFIINLLYNGGYVVKHALLRNKVNAEFIRLQQHKSGTPTMGGLIVAVPFLALSLLFLKDTPLRNTFVLGFGLFSFYGLLDEVLVKKNIQSEAFRAFQESFMWRLGKLALLYAIGLVVAMMLGKQLGIDEISIAGFFTIPFGGMFSFIWAFIIIAGTYGAEITDGLDGLVTGLFLVGYVSYAVVAVLTGRPDLLPLIGLLLGPLLVYLYFNITPARVFMGGVGAIPLGFGLVYLALATDTFLPFIFMTLVFWIELLSSVSQIIAIRFFHRKIFRIAPIHHHFESIGWSEPKIVMRFWLAGAVLALVGLWILTVV
jgi:phospho-N-acetylmuramoyl-pentapeptide-transferase